MGAAIACLLADSGRYQVYIADKSFCGEDIKRVLALGFDNVVSVAMNLDDSSELCHYFNQIDCDAIISALPAANSHGILMAACEMQCHYFDMSEDRQLAEKAKQAARGQDCAIVPQCGIAPGMIGLIANDLMQGFEQLESAFLRVGRLPALPTEQLHYAEAWCMEGLINEYTNSCLQIQNSALLEVKPLTELESITIGQKTYEAFNTAGGLGQLPYLYQGQIKALDFKSLRYPGHLQKLTVLFDDLKLQQDKGLLKSMLERLLFSPQEDQVILSVEVLGSIANEAFKKSYYKTIVPQQIAGEKWSAIQVATAAGLCAVIDEILQAETYRGFVAQETLNKANLLDNSFGQYFQE